MSEAEDRLHMRHALGLARRGLGRVWPNPAVGCVIVRDGRVCGRGWTQDGGRPHAETMALGQAAGDARGATAFVTLEPCAHHGQTPPCASAMIDAGVARVVSALDDPDPRVSGRGYAMLEAAGVALTRDVLREEAAEVQRGFLTRVTQGRPMLTLKLAASLDGRIATPSGESRWITGPAARRHVHAMRAVHDAVMVGGGTARQDDPALTVRGLGISRQPVRIVVSRLLDLPQDGQLARTARDLPLWLLHGSAASAERRKRWSELGTRLVECAERGGALDLVAAMTALADAGLTRIYCEGGGELAAALLSAGLVDRLHLYTGGIALGGDGRAALASFGLDALAAAPRFTLTDQRTLGPDTFSHWVRSERTGGRSAP